MIPLSSAKFKGDVLRYSMTLFYLLDIKWTNK